MKTMASKGILIIGAVVLLVGLAIVSSPGGDSKEILGPDPSSSEWTPVSWSAGRLPADLLATDSFMLMPDREPSQYQCPLYPVGFASWQVTPKAAFDGVNNLVVWSDKRKDEGDIWADLVVDQNGQIVVSKDPKQISASYWAQVLDDGAQVNPAVAYDPNTERYLVVWESDGDIYGVCVSVVGGWISVLNQNLGPVCNSAGNQKKPDIVYDYHNQCFLVIWEDSRLFNDYVPSVYAARVDITNPSNGEFTILPVGGAGVSPSPGAARHGAYDPKAAYENQNNTFLVVWEDVDPAAQHDICGTFLTISAGGIVASDILTTICTEPRAQCNPSIAYGISSDYDGFLVAWEDSREEEPGHRSPDIYANTLTTTGALGSEFVICENSCSDLYEYTPSVSHNPSIHYPKFLVAWVAIDTYLDLRVATVDVTGGGVVVKPEDGLIVRDGASLPFVSLSQDNYLVVFQYWSVCQYAEDGPDAWGALVAPGFGQDDPQVLTASHIQAANHQWAPAVAYDKFNDQFLVVWEDEWNPLTAARPSHDIAATRVRVCPVSDPDGGFYYVYSLDPVGIPVDKWGNTGPPNFGPYICEAPDVAFGGRTENQARFLVVWQWRWMPHSDFLTLVAKRVDHRGVILDDDPIQIGESFGMEGSMNPAVAFDGVFNNYGDYYLVVWQTYDWVNQRWNILGRRIDLNGNLIDPQDDPIEIESGAGDQTDPDVAFGTRLVDGEYRDAYLVVWEHEGDIKGSWVDPETRDVFPLPGAICSAADDQKHPRVAYDTDQALFVVVWEHWQADPEDVDIYWTSVTADGTVGSPCEIYAGDNDQVRPAIDYGSYWNGVGHSNAFCIVWEDWRSYPAPPDIRGARGNYDPQGQEWNVSSYPICLETGLEQMPAVAAGGISDAPHFSESKNFLVLFSGFRSFHRIWGMSIRVFSSKCGDANGDGEITVADVVYLVNFLFRGGPPPDPLWVGDVNGDGFITVGDIIYLLNYLYRGGPPPGC